MIMHRNENKVRCRNAVSNVLRLYKCVRSIVDFQQLCGSRTRPAIVFQRVSRLLASFADRNVSLFSLLCVCNKCVLIHVHAVVEITPFAMSYRAATPIPVSEDTPSQVFALKRTELPHNPLSYTGRSNSVSVYAGTKNWLFSLEAGKETLTCCFFFLVFFWIINHDKLLNYSP